MKRLILCALILIGTVCYSHSQEFQIPIDAPQISYYRDGVGNYFYRIPFERASVIDYWARKGITSQSTIEYTTKLMEQIRIAKMQSDSMSIAINRELLLTKNKVEVLYKNNFDLQKAKTDCESSLKEIEAKLDVLEQDNKKLKKKLFWKNVSIIGTYVAGGVLAGVLLSN